jgi:predicted site-specific integrase-resolvase
MKVSIGQAAEELGVAKETLRRWEKSGKITVERTQKGHRRYDLSSLRGVMPRKNFDEKYTVAYARVSSHDQKEDLKRQVFVEDDLVQDVLEIITVFSARLYGSRSRKNKKIVEALQNAAKEI